MRSSDIKTYVIYDDSCPVCSTAIEKIHRKNKNGFFYYIPSSKNLPEEMSHLIQPGMLQKTVIVISEGKLYTELDALSKILKEIGGIHAFFGTLINIPLIKSISKWGYRKISANRHHVSRYFIKK